MITVSQEYKKINLKFIFLKINIAAIFHPVPSPPAREQRQGFADRAVCKNSFPPSVSGYGLQERWNEKGGVTEPSSYQHPSSDGPSRRNTPKQKKTERLICSEGSVLSYHTISSSLLAQIKQIFSCHSFHLQRKSLLHEATTAQPPPPPVACALPNLFVFKTCSDLRL